MFKLNLASILGLLASVNASASASDLVGKWAAPCSVANSAGTEFTSTLNEFKADGTVESGNLVYGDSACAGRIVRKDQTDVASYAATATSIQIDAIVRGHTFSYTAEYKVAGDNLVLTYTKIVVDGQNQPAKPATVLKRVP